MDLDDDIAPLLEKMTSALSVIQTRLTPLLQQLDEDTVVSQYSIDEQARIYLSAAFTLTFSLYSLDKINNKQSHAQKPSKKTHTANASYGDGVDPQIVRQIERIAEYIKKLREITIAEKARREEANIDSVAVSDPAGEGSTAAPISALLRPGNKRVRDDTTALIDAHSSDLGDEEMFKVVSRVPGEAGVLLSRLVKHVQP